MWHYQETTIETAPDGAYGFIYLITRKDTGRMYVGRKYLTMSGGKRKPRKASDWLKYWGSCKPLLEEIKELGHDAFKREILHWCATRAATNYKETEEQFARDVLNAKLTDGSRAYYNGNIMSRWFVMTQHTEETKAKLAAAGKKRVHSPDTKAKLSVAGKGKIATAEHKAAISRGLKGHSISEATRKKIAQARMTEGSLGVVGIRLSVNGKRFRAAFNGKQIGTYDSLEEAVAARAAYILNLKQD